MSAYTAYTTLEDLRNRSDARQRAFVQDSENNATRDSAETARKILSRVPDEPTGPSAGMVVPASVKAPAPQRVAQQQQAAPEPQTTITPTAGAWRGRDSTGRNAQVQPKEQERTHLWHAEGSDPTLNTPYGESVGKAFALPFQMLGKAARAITSAPGSGGPLDPERTNAPAQTNLAKLREAEVARNVTAARANARTQPQGGFVDRIRYAESRGDINAVGPNVPGQGTAKSDMQVMDATNTNPGLGVVPARDNSLEERSRVGRDYAQALLKRYGNEQEAAAAYNWGLGNYDRWKAAGSDPSRMPTETRNYVAQVTSSGATQATPQRRVGASAPAIASTTPFQPEDESTSFAAGDNPIMADREMQQLQFHRNQLRDLVTKGAIRDPAQMQVAQEKLANLDKMAWQVGFIEVGRRAVAGDPNALGQLGAEIGVRVGRMPNGQVVAIDQSGKPITAPTSVQGFAKFVYDTKFPQQVSDAVRVAGINANAGITKEHMSGMNQAELVQLKALLEMESKLREASVPKYHAAVSPMGPVMLYDERTGQTLHPKSPEANKFTQQ